MILDTIVWVALAIFGCIGFVQAVAWTMVRAACKQNAIYRVIPIGGEGKDIDRQLALAYTCLQWEANPSRQQYVLYNAGLDEKGMHDCEELAQIIGAVFIKTPEELPLLLGAGRSYLHS